MTRAVADLAVTAKSPERLAHVRDRISRYHGKAHFAAVLALGDALSDHADRPMMEFCSDCSGSCVHP